MSLYLFMNADCSTQVVHLIKDGFSTKLFDPGSISDRKCQNTITTISPKWRRKKGGKKKGGGVQLLD